MWSHSRRGASAASKQTSGATGQFGPGCGVAGLGAESQWVGAVRAVRDNAWRRRNVMITAGTILMEKEASHPHCFQLQDDSCPYAWMSVTHNLTPHELEEEVSATGWTFFFMANLIRTTAFGLHRSKMIAGALKRLIAGVKLQKCNCLEIHNVATHSFLGMPYVSISAHPRHIQKGMVFSGR
jgi:hypothetical protein